jgi:release factor glutamine methyltransferase
MLEYKGLRIETSDLVYAPAEDSFLMESMIDTGLSGKDNARVLDIGTGTGFLGIAAGTKRNVHEVIFTDINPDAVDTARRNAERNSEMVVSKCNFVMGDLFSGIEGKFDLIIFNAPYLKGEGGEEVLSEAWEGGKEGVELSIRFLKESKAFLKERGRILISASSLANIQMLTGSVSMLGFAIEAERKVHIFFEDIFAFLLRAA